MVLKLDGPGGRYAERLKFCKMAIVEVELKEKPIGHLQQSTGFLIVVR